VEAQGTAKHFRGYDNARFIPVTQFPNSHSSSIKKREVTIINKRALIKGIA
jgi:hypothetical protein